MRHGPTLRLTSVGSGASHATRKSHRAPALVGLTLALLGAGQVAGCLAAGDEQEELELGSTEQAIVCGSQTETLAQGALSILGAIPLISEFTALPAALAGVAVSLTCEAEDLAVAQANVAGIAKETIDLAALDEVRKQAEALANSIKSNTTPTAGSWDAYAGIAVVLGAKSRAVGFIAVDSWMAASAIRLGALRAKLDMQTSAVAAHKVVEELRSVVQQVQQEAAELEDLLAQHRNGGRNSTDFRQRSWTEGVWAGRTVIENTYYARVQYPNQVTPFEVTRVCDSRYPGWGTCQREGRSWAEQESVDLLTTTKNEMWNAFYSENYVTFREDLLEILVGLDEWHALNNLAAGRPTSQSTTAFNGVASRAVDGHRDSNTNSITQTAYELEPHWQVDLGRTQRIEGVVLYSHTDDCCSGLLSNLEVGLYDEDGRQVAAPQSLDGPNGSWHAYDFNADMGGGYQARFVRIQMKNVGKYRSLQLAEVYVYGMNRARGRPTAQSTTDHEGTPERAVDGKVNGHDSDRGVTLTMPHTGSVQSWEVDLGAMRNIGDVLLWNRTDGYTERLGELVVKLIARVPTSGGGKSSSEVGALKVGSSGAWTGNLSVWTGNFNGLLGNVLQVQTQSAGQLVSLAEVEVFEQFTNMRTMPNTRGVYAREFDARRAFAPPSPMLTNSVVFRPSNGYWYGTNGLAVQWGQEGDVPVPGDYDGDGAVDIAIWRPSTGHWAVRNGADIQWGDPADIPVPGDYNGDGKTDFAVWRPSNGYWYVRNISEVQWGDRTDIPVPGDYNGDGKTDIAVWRPSTGNWHVNGRAARRLGQLGDVPVPADYNGDGKVDFAVFRPSNGAWAAITMDRKSIQDATWGHSGDVPVAGDYDGDGKASFGIWYPTGGNWWVQSGAQGMQWGVPSDLPVCAPASWLAGLCRLGGTGASCGN